MSLSVSERLRQAAASIWEECLRHPFVTGIGDGTLPVEKFQYFMLQDYLYLFDYAKVFALGAMLDLGHGRGPMNHLFDLKSEYCGEDA